MIDGKQKREAQEMYVVKSNELIQKARYNLTVQQQKLILFAISKIRLIAVNTTTKRMLCRELLYLTSSIWRSLMLACAA